MTPRFTCTYVRMHGMSAGSAARTTADISACYNYDTLTSDILPVYWCWYTRSSVEATTADTFVVRDTFYNTKYDISHKTGRAGKKKNKIYRNLEISSKKTSDSTGYLGMCGMNRTTRQDQMRRREC